MSIFGCNRFLLMRYGWVEKDAADEDDILNPVHVDYFVNDVPTHFW
jgi:hypothetical protein